MDENSQRTQNSSVATSTVSTITPKIVANSTSTSIKTSISTLSLTNTTTPKPITMPVNSLDVTFTTVEIPTFNLNSTTTKLILKPTMVKNSTISSTTMISTKTIPTKPPIRTLKWINITFTTSVVKTSTIPLKPKIIRAIPTLAIKPTTTTTRKIYTTTTTTSPKPVTQTLSTRIITMRPNKSIQKTTTADATLNAQAVPISDSSGIPKISIIIAICVMLSALLFAWKYFSANKWNNFNSHQIEFKSNYPTEGTDESLISRGDSFYVDNDVIDDKTLIHSDCNDDDGDCGDGDLLNDRIGRGSPNGDYYNGNHTGTKPKRIATKTKFMKNSNRSGRIFDQYSEKRYLMNSAGDDEQFDFTPQTTL